MKFNRIAAISLGALAALSASVATASHSWNNYHWSRTTSSFTLQVIDSNTSNWDDELSRALSQWSQSSKLDMRVSSYDDSASTRYYCRMALGKVRSCNYSYGSNGWLGLASINLDSSGHINQGSSKMNDSYSSSFSSQNERWHVMCQELGHTIGLGHTSEDGSSQNTCMDYSQSQYSTAPNAHDYNMLASIYGHYDNHNSYSTSSAMTASSASSAATANARLSPSQKAMVGDIPLGSRIRTGLFSETYAAPDGRGGVYITEVYLAPGYEHTELLDSK
jgi:hypothetical protein